MHTRVLASIRKYITEALLASTSSNQQEQDHAIETDSKNVDENRQFGEFSKSEKTSHSASKNEKFDSKMDSELSGKVNDSEHNNSHANGATVMNENETDVLPDSQDVFITELTADDYYNATQTLEEVSCKRERSTPGRGKDQVL